MQPTHCHQALARCRIRTVRRARFGYFFHLAAQTPSGQCLQPVREENALNFAKVGLGQAPDRRAIVDQCIVEHNSSGNPGGFGSLHRGDVSHVFPVAVRSVNGSVTPVRPALDAIVDFPQARRTVLDTISLILRQAGNQTGTPIVVGTVSGMRTNQLIWLEARQIAARDALLLALNAQQAINMEAGLPRVPTSWAMLYQADQKTYYFNLHAVWVTAGPTPTVAAPRN